MAIAETRFVCVWPVENKSPSENGSVRSIGAGAMAIPCRAASSDVKGTMTQFWTSAERRFSLEKTQILNYL